MLETLKIIHFLALMFGAAASFGNLYLIMAKGPHDLPSPAFSNQLRFMFRITALIAILTIWASGLMLMFAKYGLWVNGFAFDAKIVFATIVLLIILFLNLLAFRTPKSAGPPPAYIPILHMIGAPSLILAMIFAVVAFN